MNSQPNTVPPRPRRSLRLATLWPLLAAAFAGCDFPTDAPEWETLWRIRGEETRIPVDSLLPQGLRVGATGTAFEVALSPVSFARTLGELCGSSCLPANGAKLPKPAFTAALGGSIALPRDVGSVAFAGGEIEVRIGNGLGFDPIRPGPTAYGYLLLTASDGARVLATDSIAGEAVPFATGTALNRTLQLGADSARGPIRVELRVVSPPGEPVILDENGSLSVTAAPPPHAAVTRASVVVADRIVRAAEVHLRLGEVDEQIVERTRSGTLLIRMENPFPLTGSGSITLTSPQSTVRKDIQVAAGSTLARVPLSQDEARSILGQDAVRMDVVVSVDAASGSVTVRPGQMVGIETELELLIASRRE